MIQDDLIRERLKDPRIISIEIEEDEKGVVVEVEIEGTKKHLRRIVSEHFDIEGEVLHMVDKPTMARLRPKW